MALARAGAAVFQAGCIGQDGGILLQCMHDSGINTKYLRTVDDKTGHAIIQVDKETFCKQSAFRVDSVDTTGAGDTFTGYFISCIAKGRSPKSAMRYASAASAITVSRKGASSSIPWIQEVEDRLQTLELSGGSALDDTKNKVMRFFDQHYCDATLKMLSVELGYTPLLHKQLDQNSYPRSYRRGLAGRSCPPLA